MPILISIGVTLAISLSRSFSIDDVALLVVLHTTDWTASIWSVLSTGSKKSLERVIIRTLTGLGSRVMSLSRENVGGQVVLHLPWSSWRSRCWGIGPKDVTSITTWWLGNPSVHDDKLLDSLSKFKLLASAFLTQSKCCFLGFLLTEGNSNYDYMVANTNITPLQLLLSVYALIKQTSLEIRTKVIAFEIWFGSTRLSSNLGGFL